MAQFEQLLKGYNSNVDKKERDIIISIRTGTKTRKLKHTFKKNDLVSSIQQAYIDEINPDKEPDKLILGYRNKNLSGNKTLLSYKITRAATITLRFKTPGGAFQLFDDEKHQPKSKYNDKRRLDTDDPRIKLSRDPCCVYEYTDQDGIQRATMPCGHAISPPAMLKWIKTIYGENENNFEINCPKCKQEWDFSLCLTVAVLNDNDYSYYDAQYEIRSAPEEKRCPFCQEFNERPDDLLIFRVNCNACKGGDWCWNCEKPWKGQAFVICGNVDCATAEINEDLRTCDLKDTTYHIDNDEQKPFVKVPEIRACPKCFCFIEHETACKHMKCPDCKTNFCFACLKLKGSNDKWPCGEHYNECPVAPRQQLK
eukprot:543046_1